MKSSTNSHYIVRTLQSNSRSINKIVSLNENIIFCISANKWKLHKLNFEMMLVQTRKQYNRAMYL